MDEVFLFNEVKKICDCPFPAKCIYSTYLHLSSELIRSLLMKMHLKQ